MQLAKEVKTFSSACEHILSAIAMNRPLTPEEALMIEYYCVEILGKIAPLMQKPTAPSLPETIIPAVGNASPSP